MAVRPVWHGRAARAHARHLRPAPRLAPRARRPAPARSRSRRCSARSTTSTASSCSATRRADGGPGDAGDGDRRAGPARDRRARSARTARSILVPGNHDAPLVRRWLRATGGPDGLDAPVPPSATPMLARVVTAARAGARAGPLPRRLAHRPRSTRPTATTSTATCCRRPAYGVARGLLGRVPRDGATPADYERARSAVARPHGALVARTPRPLAALWDDLGRDRARLDDAGPPPAVLRRRLAPLTAFVLGLQMRRASLPALGRVVHRLGVDADHVVFGHVHRCRPAARRRPAALARPGRHAAARATRGPGSTRRCSCTGRGRRTRTGRAARSSSRTTGQPRASGCSTTSGRGRSTRLRRAPAAFLRARSAGPRRPARARARRRARRGRPP